MITKPRVTIWNEFIHERKNEEISKLYPQGMHGAIANYLQDRGFEVQTATLEQPGHGLSDEVLAATDVLIWWGHMAHDKVDNEIVHKVHNRIVADGMGLILLHSAHFSKIFIKLMGTTCNLKWREIGEKERLWVVNPAHPIVRGLGDYLEIPNAEMYGEHFDIPQPDELVFVSWFQGGEVFRSGCCFYRGRGQSLLFPPRTRNLPNFLQSRSVTSHRKRDRLGSAFQWPLPEFWPYSRSNREGRKVGKPDRNRTP